MYSTCNYWPLTPCTWLLYVCTFDCTVYQYLGGKWISLCTFLHVKIHVINTTSMEVYIIIIAWVTLHSYMFWTYSEVSSCLVCCAVCVQALSDAVVLCVCVCVCVCVCTHTHNWSLGNNALRDGGGYQSVIISHIPRNKRVHCSEPHSTSPGWLDRGGRDGGRERERKPPQSVCEGGVRSVGWCVRGRRVWRCGFGVKVWDGVRGRGIYV